MIAVGAHQRCASRPAVAQVKSCERAPYYATVAATVEAASTDASTEIVMRKVLTMVMLLMMMALMRWPRFIRVVKV